MSDKLLGWTISNSSIYLYAKFILHIIRYYFLQCSLFLTNQNKVHIPKNWGYKNQENLEDHHFVNVHVSLWVTMVVFFTVYIRMILGRTKPDTIVICSLQTWILGECNWIDHIFNGWSVDSSHIEKLLNHMRVYTVDHLL